MTDPNASFAPDWTSPHGDSIADLIEERSWTQAELAERLGYSARHVNRLVQGKVALTEDAALRLEPVQGASAGPRLPGWCGPASKACSVKASCETPSCRTPSCEGSRLRVRQRSGFRCSSGSGIRRYRGPNNLNTQPRRSRIRRGRPGHRVDDGAGTDPELLALIEPLIPPESGESSEDE